MIMDVTGIELIPGCQGKHCPGNGIHRDSQGQLLECCCEECDYYMCCSESHSQQECECCEDGDCPHAKKKPARR